MASTQSIAELPSRATIQQDISFTTNVSVRQVFVQSSSVASDFIYGAALHVQLQILASLPEAAGGLEEEPEDGGMAAVRRMVESLALSVQNPNGTLWRGSATRFLIPHEANQNATTAKALSTFMDASPILLPACADGLFRLACAAANSKRAAANAAANAAAADLMTFYIAIIRTFMCVMKPSIWIRLHLNPSLARTFPFKSQWSAPFSLLRWDLRAL